MSSTAIQMPRYVRAKLSIPKDVQQWLLGRDADIFGIYDNIGKCPDWYVNGDLDSVTKDLLFTPNQYGNTPLDSPFTWDSFHSWAKRLVDAGDPLTKADLLRTNHEGRTWLEQAARSGHFDTVVQYLGARGEFLDKSQLLDAKGEANGVLEAAVAWKQHGALFAAKHWNHAPLEDFQALVAALPKAAVEQIPNRFSLHQQLRMEQNGQHSQRGR